MMQASEKGDIPDWAVRDREQDLVWIRENTHVLLSVAKLAFEESGRGAIVVDTNIVIQQEGHSGNPMYYLPAQQIVQNGWLPAIKMVRDYDPSWEFVAVLLKKDRESAYWIGVPAAKKG